MKLYIYDHCPFCVRARMIFGLREMALENEILLNDDEDTPIRMIGVKQVPILEKEDGTFMGESLDIVRYIDERAGRGRLKEEVRPALQAWLDKVGEYNNKLGQPRMVKIGLPEFATAEAVRYFVNKKEKNIGSFETHLNKTSQYLEWINADLSVLETLISSEGMGINGDVGMEDILLFPIIRNLTIVRGIRWPDNVMDYLLRMSAASRVDLHLDRAL